MSAATRVQDEEHESWIGKVLGFVLWPFAMRFMYWNGFMAKPWGKDNLALEKAWRVELASRKLPAKAAA